MEAVMISSCISEFTNASLVRIFYFPTTLPQHRKLDQMAFKSSLYNATLGYNFVAQKKKCMPPDSEPCV